VTKLAVRHAVGFIDRGGRKEVAFVEEAICHPTAS